MFLVSIPDIVEFNRKIDAKKRGPVSLSGVDVWLNNPRRPLEASGTSGQKVVLNGGLNCSVRYCFPSARFDHHGKPTPPSIVSVEPVMYDASSLSVKQTP